jgi:hypothetical protein
LERLTLTNIRKLTKDTPLMESGLLGPVKLDVQSVGNANSKVAGSRSLCPPQPCFLKVSL